MASDLVCELTDENFQAEVLEADLPVLVDFGAEWCGPCRMIAPIIEEIAAENEGKLKVGKVNVDDAGETATAYGIQSIPSLLLFVGGELKVQLTGALPKGQILDKIGSHIGAG